MPVTEATTDHSTSARERSWPTRLFLAIGVFAMLASSCSSDDDAADSVGSEAISIDEPDDAEGLRHEQGHQRRFRVGGRFRRLRSGVRSP